MNINVPDFAVAHFWENEPPGTTHEFWALRFPPKCKPGDPIVFHIQGTAVARAVVDYIEAPGKSTCEGTGRYLNR
jgi:hypothetical protein